MSWWSVVVQSGGGGPAHGAVALRRQLGGFVWGESLFVTGEKNLLNADDPFLPLALTSSDLLLVQKSQIAVVRTALPTDDDIVDRGVVGMHVELTFVFGDTKTGSVFPELRADRPRLIDFLNQIGLGKV